MMDAVSTKQNGIDWTNFFSVLFGLGIGLAYIVAAVCVRGFLIAQVWAWFGVPLFGLPELSIPTAIGLYVLAATFRSSKRPEKQSNKPLKEHVKDALYEFIQVGWLLLLGYVAHLVMVRP